MLRCYRRAPQLCGLQLQARKVQNQLGQLAAVLPQLPLVTLEVACSEPDDTCANMVGLVPAVATATTLQTLGLSIDRGLDQLPSILAALPQLSRVELSTQTACEAAGPASVLRSTTAHALLNAASRLRTLFVQTRFADLDAQRFLSMPQLTALVLNDFGACSDVHGEHNTTSYSWVAPVPTLVTMLRNAPALRNLQLANICVLPACARLLWAAIGSLSALTALVLSIADARACTTASWYTEQARTLRHMTGLQQLTVQHTPLSLSGDGSSGEGAALDAATAALRASVLQLRCLNYLAWPMVHEVDLDSLMVPLISGLPRLMRVKVDLMYADVEGRVRAQIGLQYSNARTNDEVMPALLRRLHTAACKSGARVSVDTRNLGDRQAVAPLNYIVGLMSVGSVW